MTEMTNKIVSNIKRIAGLKNMKIADIEENIDVSHGYFSRCRKGKCTLSVEKLMQTADLLGVQMDVLFKEVQNGWKKESSREKSMKYICPVCGDKCYFVGKECTYKFCPNCGKQVLKNEKT
ncbi:MAG: helix-turn-helix transcriptional regulator [Oscillospiraceae bacterium]